MLPEVTAAGMAEFNVKPELRDDPSAEAALEQVALLVQSQVGIDDLDADDVKGRTLYTNAVYELAHLLLIDKRHAAEKRRPYKAETLGNYAYTAGNVAGLVESSIWLRLLDAHTGVGTVR